jgi:uncharacterized protein YaaR (DUF327 family)
MRIPEPTGQFGDPKSQVEKLKKGGKGAARHVSRDSVNELNFTKQLDGAAEEQVKKDLDQLIEELSEQAKVLEKHRTFGELEKYKKMVKAFMDQAIRKIYTVKISDSSKLMMKRKKIYIMVEQVDAELERLTKQVLEKNAAPLDLLATLEKIKGMLVDMYS